ncbi:Lsr2 family DNA-binding protein [Streptomyces sp. LNU-CPARS28]|uniref:Lsr2 family DNA-binding protein n=1 Tax=Streptomyces sp. LNU-CPARS28 TaxID=3137371 RepID=UPI003136F81F
MTIAALGALLKQIDRQGGPDAARHGRLHLDNTEPDMDTQPEPTAPDATTAPGDELPVGKLLAWGYDHTDMSVQSLASQISAGLADLRRRYTTDHELAQITSEAEKLEQRLADLRARQEELAPTPPRRTKRGRKPAYPAATVRAWARENGMKCGGTGRVPKHIVDAWRAANPDTAAPAP